MPTGRTAFQWHCIKKEKIFPTLIISPPGTLFECHLELVLDTPDSGETFLFRKLLVLILYKFIENIFEMDKMVLLSGFLVYFDSLALAQPSKGE